MKISFLSCFGSTPEKEDIYVVEEKVNSSGNKAVDQKAVVEASTSTAELCGKLAPPRLEASREEVEEVEEEETIRRENTLPVLETIDEAAALALAPLQEEDAVAFVDPLADDTPAPQSPVNSPLYRTPCGSFLSSQKSIGLDAASTKLPTPRQSSGGLQGISLVLRMSLNGRPLNEAMQAAKGRAAMRQSLDAALLRKRSKESPSSAAALREQSLDLAWSGGGGASSCHKQGAGPRQQPRHRGGSFDYLTLAQQHQVKTAETDLDRLGTMVRLITRGRPLDEVLDGMKETNERLGREGKFMKKK